MNTKELVRNAVPSVAMWNVRSVEDMELAVRFCPSYSFGESTPEALFEALMELREKSPSYRENEDAWRRYYSHMCASI